MKLHLPNGLRKAVMACMAALTTLTTTVGTGIITGGAVTYIMAAPQAEAVTQWSLTDKITTNASDTVGFYADPNTGTPIEVNKADITNESLRNRPIVQIAPETNQQTTNVNVTLYNGDTLRVIQNPWTGTIRNHGLLSVKQLTVGGGATSDVVNIDVDADQGAEIINVAGSIGTIVNDGVLALGSNAAASSINIGGAVTNNGTLTLRGTLVNTGSLTLGGTVEISKEWGALAGYSEGENGYLGYSAGEITVIQGGYSGDVTFVRDGKTVTLTDGKLQVEAYSDETVYYLNKGTGTVTKTADFTPTGAIVQNTGESIELVGLKDADLTNKVQVNVNSTLVIGNGSDITDAVVMKGCDTLSLTVNKGGKFTLTQEVSSTPYDGNITVNGGGTLLLDQLDTLGWGNTDGCEDPLSINIGGGDETASLQMTNRTTLSTIIYMKGNAVIENPKGVSVPAVAGMDGLQFTVNATGTDNVISCPVMGTHVADDVTVNVVGEGDTLEITGKLYNRSGALDFIKQGAGTLLLSNAESVVDGMFTMGGGVTHVTKNLELTGGLTMLATAGATIDSKAIVTINGGTVQLNGTNDFGAGTLNFKGAITLDVSAFADFDPTVAGSSITLGKVGAITMEKNASLALTTDIDLQLMPVITLDDDNNIVLSIQQRALSWVVTETEASLNTYGKSVTVNYQDGQYVAVYEGGTAVSDPAAEGTGKIQLMPYGELLQDSATITLESGTYSGVMFMGVNNTVQGTYGSASDQKKLTLNITGDASVTNFIDSTGAQGLVGWGGDKTKVELYTDVEFNVNTTGSVAALVLTAEANNNGVIKVYGDLTAKIQAGTIGAMPNDAVTHASLAAGGKAIQINGDITYNLGALGATDDKLVFNGNIVGTISMAGRTTVDGAKSEGDVVINLNSGTYQSVYGVGSLAPHTGDVTINYYGGTINGIIKGSAGAAVNGANVLNVAGVLDASKIDMGSFTSVNVLDASTLTVSTNPYTLDISNVTFATGATLEVTETGVCNVSSALSVDGNLVLNGTLNMTSDLDPETAQYSDNGTDGYLSAELLFASAGGSLTLGESASIAYKGVALESYTNADNKITATITDKSVYHVNSADYEYSATKIGATSTISIAETGELVIKTTGNTIAGIEMAEGGKVVIDNSEETSLNNIFGSAIDLTGTVVFKGSEVVNINGNDNGNLNNSDLIIDGGKVVVDIPNAHANMNGDITVTNSGVLTFKDNDTLVEGTAQKITIDGGTLVSDGRTVFGAGDQVVLNNGTMSGTGDPYGAFDFDASLTVQVSGDSTISGPVRLQGGYTVSIELADGAELSFGNTNHANNQNNAGTLKFTGNGVTTLKGTLGHTGGTTVEGGVLALAGTASFGSTTVTIAGGATLGLGTTALSMADATLALQNGSILSLAALSADTTPLTLKAVQQDGTVYIDTNAVEAVSAGTYNILAGTGMDVTKFALYGANAGKFVASYALTADNVLQMTLALNDKALVWTGDTEDNVWNGTAENTPWEKLDGTVSAFAEKNVVNFTTDTPVEERTVTIADTVAPAAAYVYGTDWEWTGAGAINCSGALTVGDGSETELTIANTGAKTFTGGVIVNEGATLVVENADGWTGKVSGAGTLEVSVGTTLAQTGDSHWLVDRVGKDDGALNTIRLSGNTFIDQQSSSNDANNWLNAITTLEIEAGSCYAYNIGDGKNFTYSVVMKLAGSGGAGNMGGALSLLSHPDWVGADKAGGQSTIINIDGIELMDDATIYVGAGKAINKATVGAAVTSAGHTLTLTGGGQLALVRAFNDAFAFNIAQGTLFFDGSDLTGTGSATIADGATFHIKGRVDGAWKEIKLTDVTMVGGSLLNLENYRNQEIGTLTMDNGAKVRMENSLPSIDKLIVAAEDVATLQVDTTLGSCTTAIGTVEGAGTITLTRDGDGRGTIHRFDLVGENSFSGTWLLNKHISIRASHEDALANAVVELNWEKPDDASKKAKFELATETVKLKGLQGSIGTVDAEAVTSCELQFNTAGGDYSYGGNFDVSNKVNIVKNGAGSQSFTNTTNFAGNITVNEGTLKLSTAQSSAGREISIAGGAILGTALTLNGGTLSLDTTGATAASLGDNSLTLTVGTMLNLTVLGTEVTGTQITLLGGISEMKNVIVGENGSLGLLGDSFTLGVITDKSVSVDTPAVADAGAVDAWADRLGRSELFYDEEKGLLYLSLASNILAADPLYWDPTDADDNGNWLGSNWSEEDKLGVDPGTMQDPWPSETPVSVVFAGDPDAAINATVTIDTDAVVNDMTVKNGTYTYVKDGETGTLTIESELTVEDTGSADISGMGSVSADSLDVAGTLVADELTVGDSATVTGSVAADTLTITDAATVDGGTLAVTNTLGAASMAATNGASVTADVIEITGTAEINGASVEGTNSLTANKIVISGDTASVTTGGLVVGEGGLSMTGGTLNSGTISGEGTAEISGGTVTIDNSTLSSTTVTGATFAGNSTLDGDADSVISVGGVTVGDGAALSLNDATLTDQINVAEGGTLTIGGAMHLDTTAKDFGLVNTSTYAETEDESDTGALIADGGDGFVSRNEVYTVITGDTDAATSTADWTVGADKLQGEYDNGKVTVSESKDTTTYWVNNNVTLSTVSDNFVDDTTTIKLNGGVLQMNENTDLDIVTNNENPHKTDSQISMGNDVTLEADKLTIADGTTVKLTGLSKAVLDLGDAAGVDENLTGLTEDTWAGTVTTAATAITDVAALGNAGSAVELTGAVDTTDLAMGDVGTVNATKSLTADSITGTGALEVDGLTTLKKGASSVGNAAFDGGLVLGGDEAAALTGADLTAASVELQKGSLAAETLTVGGAVTIADGSLEATALNVEGATTVGSEDADTASTLTVNGDAALTGGLELANGSTAVITGDLTLEDGAIKYNDLDSSVTAGALMDDTLALEVDTDLLKAAVDAGEDVTLLTLTQEASDAEISLNGGSNELAAYGEKYTYSLDWDDTGMNVTLDATANENYMKEKYSDGTPNGLAGAAIMDEAFANDTIATGGDLEKVLAAVDNNTMTDEGLAAVAGSSTASLGMAFAGDVERQLRAIRNRTTTMGVNQCVVNEGMPYFNAWVNAEGNLGELDKDGTYAGYKLDSWGGTVGFDVDVNPNLTLGLAVTAMYGDLTVDGPDMLDGDMDTYYVTAFARYSKRAWTHTFIGTIGKMDGSYERTVNYAGGSYKTEGDTDGMAFGLMYEVGRVYALTEDGDACLQPVFNIAYRHTTVGGYTEDSSDAALDVDDQTLDTITLGAGARFQAVVGENLYNRTSVLELRSLAKLDVGDRASEADVAFIGGSRATVESAELGAFGVELGAGLSIPVGDENDGTIFFDVSTELRSGYSNVNGTVGYRINF